MIKEVYSYVASFVIIMIKEHIDLDEKKINDLTFENERLSKVNMSLNKKLEDHALGSKEFDELKDKILSLELNLKDSNDRLGILKQEIEQRDCSLVNAKKLENVLKSKLNEHLNQEKKYEQWLDKSRKDVMFSDDIAEKYAIELRMLREKLDEANRVISKISSSSNKVETLIKSGKHPCDKRGLGYINEKDTPSSNKSTFVKASIESNVGTLSQGKAMKATEGASSSTRMFNGRTQQHKHQEATTSNARGGASRVALQRGKIVRRPNAMEANANGKILKFIPICHHCNMVGHIRPRCFEYIRKCEFDNAFHDMSLNGPRQSSMYGYRNRPRKTLEKHIVEKVVDDLLAKSCVVPHSTMHKKVDNALFDIFENVTNEVKVHVKKPNIESKHVSSKSERHVVKNVWIRKDTSKCHVAQYALRANSSYSWYLDSGCSRNMTGNKEFFVSLDLKDGGWVTFGDGTKKQVLGKGTICIPGLPKLRNTLYVDGLQANLISITHLCEIFKEVSFNKDMCTIIDKKDNVVLRVKRSIDNCYCLEIDPLTCNMAHECNKLDLWHQRLGHMNFKSINKLEKGCIVRGLPSLGSKLESVCKPCQLGKQTKVSHKKSTSIATKKPLDLVHIANNLVKEHTRKAWIKKYDVKNVPSHSSKHVSNDNSLNIVHVNDNHVKKNVKKIWLKKSVSHDHIHSFDDIFVDGNNDVFNMSNIFIKKIVDVLSSRYTIALRNDHDVCVSAPKTKWVKGECSYH